MIKQLATSRAYEGIALHVANDDDAIIIVGNDEQALATVWDKLFPHIPREMDASKLAKVVIISASCLTDEPAPEVRS